jgi:ABC-type glycerol-3-phosphate transport system substrate-binding protein
MMLAGCPTAQEREKQAEPLSFAGQEIRIGVPADRGFRAAWEGPLNEWAAQTGATCTLTELAPEAPPVPFAALAGDDRQTLAIFPLEKAGELVGAETLAAIPPALLGDDENGVQWRDLFAGLTGRLAARKETALFVPLSCPVLVCYYRNDLLSAAGLNPPQTWDEYQQLLEKLGTWAPGMSAVEPWGESWRATTFLARAVSMAQHPGHFSLFFDIETGSPLINSPGFVRALQSARDAVAKMPREVLSYQPSDCRNAVLGGHAALGIAFESPATGAPGSEPAAEKANQRPDEIQVGFVRLPGSRETYNPTRHVWEPLIDKGIQQVTLCGFAGLAIGASSQNTTLQTEAAWNALAKVRGRDFTSGFPPAMTGLCRESQLLNPADAVGPGLEGPEAEAYANAVAASLRDLRLVAELPVAGRIEFRDSLAVAVEAALTGSQTPEQALLQAGREWREIVDKIGAARIRDNYRLSLGLRPR